MKKIYLIFAIALAFTLGLKAQTFQFTHEGNVIGDTLKLNIATGTERTDYIHFTNVTNESISAKVYKEIIQLADGGDLLMCVGSECTLDSISSAFNLEPNVEFTGFDLLYTYGNTDETLARINLIDASSLETIQSFYVLYTTDTSTTVSLEKPIKQGITSTNIEAYPNPANNNATIVYSLPTNYKSGKIVVRNMIGATIKTISINGGSKGKQSISTAELPNGVYFYSIIGDGKALSTKKLVVKH
jgi:hypothetical protein